MAVSACLRIAVDAASSGKPALALSAMVQLRASEWLERRWTWPRTFEPLTPEATLVSDPQADALDLRAFAGLSDELSEALFSGAKGKVTLLLLHGEDAALRTFAQMSAGDLAKARSDPRWLPANSRLAQLLTNQVAIETVSPQLAAAPIDARVRLHGVYFALRRLFIGDVISYYGDARSERATVVDGADRLPTDPLAFDTGCVGAAKTLLQDRNFRSLLYIPIAYDNLVRPTPLRMLGAELAGLPEGRRSQLAAIVYNVPRDPAFGAIAQIRTLLTGRFNTVDIRIEDPDFQVDKLSVNAVAGVSFALPQGDRRTRMAALRRFTDKRIAYKQLRIWASVTNVREADELEACRTLGVPFVTGPAICSPQARPLAGRMAPAEELPVRAAAAQGEKGPGRPD